MIETKLEVTSLFRTCLDLIPSSRITAADITNFKMLFFRSRWQQCKQVQDVNNAPILKDSKLAFAGHRFDHIPSSRITAADIPDFERSSFGSRNHQCKQVHDGMTHKLGRHRTCFCRMETKLEVTISLMSHCKQQQQIEHCYRHCFSIHHYR